ncbi:mannitol dehydrogenase family protein [Granulosicoccaceae sp. 1_MG-2023]|nr:mannitol dehydrogenase family protein [Granulosicoccaceae sp. 1_MG-2023]
MSGETFTQLHIGLGSFHRAHQAMYMQKLHEAGDQRWQIIAGNIRADGVQIIDALQAQNGEYVLETVTPEGERSYHRVTSIRQVVPFDEQLSGLAKVAADPATRIISFTVTEAGYYLDSRLRLDPDSYPDLRADMENGSCRTLYGAMTRLLHARMSADAGPVTFLNCDNLRSNGDRFASGFRQFLQARGEDAVIAWIDANTSAPNAMVDRIAPRPPAELRERVRAATGFDDGAPVMSESFLQWVIEDEFVAGRPAWEKVGVELVSDVGPYEEAKIRLLNATHSCFAWAGTLRGYSFIHEGVRDAEIRQMAYDYVTDNAIPCLEGNPLDLPAYRDTVLARFGNPEIKDTNGRVAMDAYAKIPGMILPTIRESLQKGLPVDAVAMLPALFLAFILREQQGGIPYPYEDQAMDPASPAAIAAAADPVAAICAEKVLFEELAGDERLLDGLRRAYRRVEAFIAAS